MKKNVKIIIACIINFLIIAALCWILEYRQKRADKELREQFNQIALQYAPAECDTIRDSVKVITQQVLMMPPKEYKLTASDRALLQDINLKVNQVVADQRTSILHQILSRQIMSEIFIATTMPGLTSSSILQILS